MYNSIFYIYLGRLCFILQILKKKHDIRCYVYPFLGYFRILLSKNPKIFHSHFEKHVFSKNFPGPGNAHDFSKLSKTHTNPELGFENPNFLLSSSAIDKLGEYFDTRNKWCQSTLGLNQHGKISKNLGSSKAHSMSLPKEKYGTLMHVNGL